jgi:hypothetical protein
MAITNQDGLIAGLTTSQAINWQKSGARTTAGSAFFSVFDLAGGQGPGVLGGTESGPFTGVVPTDSTPGCPPINTFGGGATGYLAGVQYGANNSARLRLCDMLYKVGTFPTVNSAQAITTPPSYSGRIPGGDYKGTELWLEAVTAFTTSVPIITVTYTNQDGTTGKSTGAFTVPVLPTLGRMIQIPLAAGDTGIQKIESVTSSGSSAGTFNLLVLRPLWTGRVAFANYGGVYGPELTGLPIVYDTSALIVQAGPDSAAMPIMELRLIIANG